MDPISAAASVVGLLGAAAKVSESLIKFIKSVRGAPKLTQTVLLEVSDISACLSQLQRYLLGSKVDSRSHERLLTIEQIVVALANCVKIFSELEEIVDSLKPAYPMQPGRIAQWVFKEQDIQMLLKRLNSSQISLNLMLTTITCTSVEEAQSSVDQLTTMVTQVLESNQEISQRMANMELRAMAYFPSNAPTMTNVDTISAVPANISTEFNKDDESIITITPLESDPSSQANDETLPSFGHTFDKDLNNSRPYTRALQRHPVWSTASSAVQTMGWSCLSGLSLADVSQISVINLPISSQELWNGQRYSFRAGADGGLENITEEEPHSGSVLSSSDRSPTKTRSSSLLNFKRLLRSPSPIPPSQHIRRPSPVDSVVLPVSKKIMLTGGSFSGKTTIFNHLKMLHGNNFSHADRLEAREWIVNDLINAFKAARPDLSCIRSTGFFETVDSELFDLLEVATEQDHFNSFYSLRCYLALRTLWQSIEVRTEVMNGDKAALNEHIPFYMDHIDQLFTSDNAISDDFLLRARGKTTGIYNRSIMIDLVQCQIYDTGGSRSQRKKWIECFKDLDTMIYVVSLTGYCQPLFEDETTVRVARLVLGPDGVAKFGPQNEMEESLSIFESMMKHDKLRSLPVILLLNKVDAFEEKIKKTPIYKFFPTCPKKADCMTACTFFSDHFAKLDERPEGVLRIFVTSAVDRETFEKTLQKIRPILVRNEWKQPRKSREISSPILLSSTSHQETVDLPFPSSGGPNGVDLRWDEFR